jgi:hypothetical protein
MSRSIGESSLKQKLESSPQDWIGRQKIAMQSSIYLAYIFFFLCYPELGSVNSGKQQNIRTTKIQ